MNLNDRTCHSWLGKGLMALAAGVLFALALTAPALAIEYTPGYAELDFSTDTLTFRGGLMPSSSKEYFPLPEDTEPGWLEHRDHIKTVVFDASFKEVEFNNAAGMFNNCGNLTEVKGTENVNTEGVEFAQYTFLGCSSLKTLDLSTWSTPMLWNAKGMFNGCSSLETLNLANVDTTQCVHLEGMFEGCTSLKNVTLGNKFAFKGNTNLEPDEVSEGQWDAGGILPTPPTEYKTWWRGSGKAYTPEELRELTGSDVAGTWTWYMGEQPVKNLSMFRLYNPNTGEHFYTSNTGERDATVAAGWKSEGVGWKAPSTSNTPVYRLYNEHSGGEHHYTASANERKALIAAGWKDEGIGWYSDDAKSVPVYREYNPNQLACNHNFTTSQNEHDTLVSIGWREEGIGWYGVS